MRRVEIQHNTAEQVEGYIDEALRIVTRLEVSDDLIVPAFTEAVRLLAAKNIQLETAAMPANPLVLGNHRP